MFRYEEPGFFDTSGYVPRTNPNAAYFLPPAAAPAPRSSAPRNAAGTPMPLPTSVALPAESVDFRQMPSVSGIESEYTRRLPIPQRVPLPMQPMYVTDIDLSDPSTTPQAQWGAQQAKTSAMYGATPKPSAAQAINNLAAQHAAQQAMQMGAMYGAAAPPARPSAPTRTNKGRAKQTSAAPSYYEPAAVYTNQDVRAMQRADAQRGYQRGPGVAQPVPSAAPAPAKGGARTITGQPTGVPDYVLLPDQVINPRFATGKPPAAQKPGKNVNKKASVGNAGAKALVTPTPTPTLAPTPTPNLTPTPAPRVSPPASISAPSSISTPSMKQPTYTDEPPFGMRWVSDYYANHPDTADQDLAGYLGAGLSFIPTIGPATRMIRTGVGAIRGLMAARRMASSSNAGSPIASSAPPIALPAPPKALPGPSNLQRNAIGNTKQPSVGIPLASRMTLRESIQRGNPQPVPQYLWEQFVADNLRRLQEAAETAVPAAAEAITTAASRSKITRAKSGGKPIKTRNTKTK